MVTESRTISSSGNLPPKTRGVPLIGSLPPLATQKMDFLFEEQARLGDVFRLDLGVTEMIVFAHPRHAQHILRDSARKYDKGGALWDALRDIAGKGIVTNNDWDDWLKNRRMVQPHFHRQRLQQMATTMVKCVDDVTPQLDEQVQQGGSINFNDYVYDMTMNIIIRTMFGGYLTSEEVDEAGKAAFVAFGYVFPATVMSGLPAWVPNPGKKNFLKHMQVIDSLTREVLERSRADEGAASGLFGMLINMVDEETNERMNDQQLRDEAVTMFLAGHETTAVATAWTLHLLTQNPEAMARAYTEVDEVLGDRAPTFEDLPRLKYLYRVLQESMRLRVPGGWIPRHSVEDDEIDGYRIPKNKMIFVMAHLIHHHPEIWEDPLRFDPDRFLPEHVANRHQFSWIPFGAGQRQCIGRDFSFVEGQIILARLMQRYRFEAVPDAEVKPYFIGMVQRPTSLPLMVSRR